MPILEKTLHVDEKDLHGLSDLILNESSIGAVAKKIKLEKIPAIWFLPAAGEKLFDTSPARCRLQIQVPKQKARPHTSRSLHTPCQNGSRQIATCPAQ